MTRKTSVAAAAAADSSTHESILVAFVTWSRAVAVSFLCGWIEQTDGRTVGGKGDRGSRWSSARSGEMVPETVRR